MKIIHGDNHSITVEVGYVRDLSLFCRILGGVIGLITLMSLITKGVSIELLILILIFLFLYPLMLAKGLVVITSKSIVERKKIWLKAIENRIDIHRYDEIKVIHGFTDSSNGGDAKQYSYLVLSKEGLSVEDLSLGQFFRCYDTKKDIKNFKKVINLLSKNDSRKVSFDEDSLEWFNVK
jgi:hypothetical protein